MTALRSWWREVPVAGLPDCEEDEMSEPWLEPDEWAAEDGPLGWVSRDAYPDQLAAISFARQQDPDLPDELHLVAVLLREESEVEAQINGHEFPMYVECTARAKRPLEYWRVEPLSGGSLEREREE
jgi:hypothetical protein